MGRFSCTAAYWCWHQTLICSRQNMIGLVLWVVHTAVWETNTRDNKSLPPFSLFSLSHCSFVSNALVPPWDGYDSVLIQEENVSLCSSVNILPPSTDLQQTMCILIWGSYGHFWEVIIYWQDLSNQFCVYKMRQHLHWQTFSFCVPNTPKAE